MPLPDIDFRKIRQHEGSQDRAFEELCCQLAASEPLPAGAVFNRKGRGRDGGVECFVREIGGAERGWQVKYSQAIDHNLLSSLDRSLAAALANHPQLDRYVVCLPFDVVDPRAPNATTQLDKWDDWVEGHETRLAASERALKIERWDASHLKRLLTADDALAGRILFWFDDQVFTSDWFERRLRKATDDLGPRYSPESHIDLPIRRAITAVSGEPEMRERLHAWADGLDRAIVAASAHVPAAVGPCEHLVRALRESASGTLDIPVAQLLNAAAAAHDAAVRRLGTSRDSEDRRRAHSDLTGRLGSLIGALSRPEWTHINARRLLVTGEAGRGKSHLLADACWRQVRRERPAILLLGGHFNPQEILGQIRAELDLPTHVRGQDLLGALDAAGFAAGCRTLLVIDALNERDGQEIWPDRLAGFLREAEAFPWLSVVLSCRSTYLDLVIPGSVDEARLPRLEHEGFATQDAEAYLESRGIQSPAGPYPVEEFRNPLFLKTCCDGLTARGETSFPRGSSGVSALFEMYASAISDLLTRRMRLPPRQDLVRKALAALAEAMAAKGVTALRFEEADAITEGLISSGGDTARSLSFQLETEGVLVVEPLPSRTGPPEDYLRFVFERFSDHVVAEGILSRSATTGGIADACRRPTELRDLLARTTISRAGVVEAVAVQLPERHGLELPDLDGVPLADRQISRAFRRSLRTREGSAFTPRTLELAEEEGGPALVWDTFLTVCSEPDNPFNAHELDVRLRALAMSNRDAYWSIVLGEIATTAETLTDWALRAGWRTLSAERAELAATGLTWLLTASHRQIRDRATKGIVALLATRGELALRLWTRFAEVDDGYVSERLLAAIYGAAMQSRWSTAELSTMAQAAFDHVLASGATLTPNMLTRDHARHLVAYAAACASLPPGLTLAMAEPPYTSDWPLESVPESVLAGYTRNYPRGHASRDEIVSSAVSDGDFARYVIDPAMRMFSPARRGVTPLPTAEDLQHAWRENFEATATPAMLAAYQQLEADLAAIADARSVGGQRSVADAKDRFAAVVDTEAYEHWREQCENWRARGMYQSFASPGPATFNLAWARRWVAWRAHELGWSEALHGEFDLHARSDRHTHQVERIGKKYQWLALYELRARATDNLAIAASDSYDGEPERLRNIDPSLLLEETSELGWSQIDSPTFWTPVPDLGAHTLREAMSWRDSDRDLLDGAEQIEVVEPQTEKSMLVLNGFGSWRAPGTFGHRDMWRRISSIVVRRADLDAVVQWLSGRALTDAEDLPSSASPGLHGYLGEHAWALATDPDDGWFDNWASYWDDARNQWVGAPVRARGTTGGYLQESTGYDQSIRDTIQARLPAAWIMDAMGLRLTDGRDFAYADATGEVLFYDPSAGSQGHSAALVNRAAFEAVLEARDLACLWSIAGEKNVYGDNPGDGFGGRVVYTRLHSLSRGQLVSHDRYRKLDRPSFGQLRALYA